MLDIVAWNVNGIRALPKPLKETLDDLNADVICFQETKIGSVVFGTLLLESQLDSSVGIIDGYNAYYASCKKKSGYAGVSIYCREPLRPVYAEEGLASLCSESDGIPSSVVSIAELFSPEELVDLDTEGRALVIQLRCSSCCGLQGNEEHRISIISVYCPRGGSAKPERLEFKMRFHRLLETRARALLGIGHHVIIAGDLNISHRAIDHCDPDSEKIPNNSLAPKTTTKTESTNKNSSGATATYSGTIHLDFVSTSARRWINEMLVPWQRDPVVPENTSNVRPSAIEGEESGSENVVEEHFVDTFRQLHPNVREAYSCWCSRTGARQTNYGNRIDYILADPQLAISLVDAAVQSELMGSDHCPVRASFKVTPVLHSPTSSSKWPSLCSNYLPQCTGKQLTIGHFFSRVEKSIPSASKAALKRPPGKPTQSKLNFFGKMPKLSSSFIGQSKSTSQLSNHLESSKLSSQLKSKNSSDLLEDATVADEKSVTSSSTAVDAWKSILRRQPAKPPNCHGHGLPCLLRTVKKESANKGRQFWLCCRPEGHSSNSEARCDFFRWI